MDFCVELTRSCDEVWELTRAPAESARVSRSMLNRLELESPIVRMGAQQSRMSKGSLTSRSSKGSLVDVASFDFRREEMAAAAEFRRDYFQSRFSKAQKCI